MAMGFDLSQSYLDQIDYYFRQQIGQQGSLLYNVVQANKIPVMGDSLKIRSHDVTDPYWADTAGGITQNSSLKVDSRVIQPQDIIYSIMLDEFILRKQGTENPQDVSAMMSNKLMLFSEDFIINGRNKIGGIAGAARTTKNVAANVNIPTKNVIKWFDTSLGAIPLEKDPNRIISYGLSSSKLAVAFRKLRENFVTSPIVVVASEYALSTMRADERYSNLLYNVQPAMATAQNTPFAGMQMFIPSEKVKKGIKIGTATIGGDEENIMGELAYAFALDQIVMGEGMAWSFKYMENPEREGNPMFMFKGSYDYLRLDERAVIVIHVATGSGADGTGTIVPDADTSPADNGVVV
jgi:hypothetical protein